MSILVTLAVTVQVHQGLHLGIERPEGRVHFAGEHTSAWPYWMQGALQSGLRAAKEVNDANILGG